MKFRALVPVLAAGMAGLALAAAPAAQDQPIFRASVRTVPVYSIGLESEYFNGVRVVRSRPSRDLRKISEETGGGYFELQKSVDLSPTFSRVATELRSQYLIAFTPSTLDGKVHKLEVRVNRPGMTVRARKSYLAASDRS